MLDYLKGNEVELAYLFRIPNENHIKKALNNNHKDSE